MRAAAFALAAICIFSGSSQAQNFNPFQDYHLSGRVDFSARARSRPAARVGSKAKAAKAKQSPIAAAPLFAPSEPDDDDAPQAPPKLQKAPALLQGGPRPSIAAQAPGRVAHGLPYAPGSVVIDTKGRQLFYLLSSKEAYRYPISVGRDGFTWTGTKSITRVASWPDWRPPAEMRQRDPRLPEVMTGGLYNPLGARALYLGSSLYRIHGTNNVKSIGQAASSGCFRMRNAHVLHLSTLAGVGTAVHVLSSLPGGSARKRLARN